MNDGALDDALEPGRRLRILAAVGDEVGEFRVDVIDQVPAQGVEIHVAGAHDRGRILIIDERQEQMLEGGVFVAALAGEGKGPVKGLFQTARKARQGNLGV